MSEGNKLHVYDDQPIRTAWNAEKEEWFFSVADVVQALTDSADPKQYIKKMRSRDPELASKWGTICTPVEMLAADGKKRKIQAADTKGLLRIIQSIPSPKAEPFKMWQAQVGAERIDESIDPELAIDRALETYLKNKSPSKGSTIFPFEGDDSILHYEAGAFSHSWPVCYGRIGSRMWEGWALSW